MSDALEPHLARRSAINTHLHAILRRADDGSHVATPTLGLT